MKLISKISTFCFLVFLFTFNIGALSAETTTLGTKENPYKISTAEELFRFAGIVNGTLSDGSEQNTSACAVLTSDIVINDENLFNGVDVKTVTKWVPVGNTSGNAYTGEFDGNGYSIKGVYVGEGTHRGLFGYVKGTVKNVNVKDSYIDALQSGCRAGLIAAEAENGNIINCQGTAFINVGNGVNVGGIVGRASGTTISECENYGKLSSANNYDDSKIGGIVGIVLNNSKTEKCINSGTIYISSNEARHNNVGGIAGENDASNIIECTNQIKINSYGRNNYIAGIAGCNKNKSVIADSKNTGEIRGYRDDDIGGIVGENNNAIISGCENNGKLAYNDLYVDMGGIAVYNTNGGIITDCKNTSKLSGMYNNVAGIVTHMTNSTVENCFNEGEISGNRSGDIGGIVANVSGDSSIRNCYNISKITKYNGGTSGGIAADVSSTVTIENCFNTGSCDKGSEISGSMNFKALNCYYLGTTETDSLEGTTFKTSAQFESGEVCYLLNGDQSSVVFYQNIGVNAIPLFTGKQVYFDEDTGYFN